MDSDIRQRKSCGLAKKATENSEQTTKCYHICRARLKRSATTSAILCAFAMQSMAELQVNVPTKCPVWIFTSFAVCTTTLISIHIFSLVISNFVLPSLEYMSQNKMLNVRMLYNYPNNYKVRNVVEIAWTFTTVLGLFLFLIEIVLLCWVKFYDHSLLACWAGTVVMSPFIVGYLVLCVYFYKEMSQGSFQFQVDDDSDITKLKNEIELDGFSFSVSEGYFNSPLLKR